MPIPHGSINPEQSGERRHHRRLAIRLPLDCTAQGGSGPGAGFRAVTRNISTGGIYFELELANGAAPVSAGSVLDVELTVPPGEGYFPYEGHVKGMAQVVRCDDMPVANGEGKAARSRLGIAARFQEPLTLAFIAG